MRWEVAGRLKIDELLQKAKGGERREKVDLGGVLAKELDGADAVFGEVVVDVAGEVMVDGSGGQGDAESPGADEGFDVGLTVDAGLVEVFSELGGGDGEGVWTCGPYGGDPGEAGAGVPLVGEVVPGAGADSVDGLDVGAVFESEESRVADEDGGVVIAEHGDGIGGRGDEGGVGVEEFAKEDAGVSEGAAGGGVGGDGADGGEGAFCFDDELDGADFVEGGDGAAGDDGEVGGEGCDGDKAEVGATAEELFSAEGRQGVVKVVALGECGGEGRVIEVPHEGCGVEEVDGSYADGMG